MSRVKMIVLGLLVLLVFIVILQNTKAVETKILFFTIVMPRVLLLLFTGAVGFGLGVLYALKRVKRQEACPDQEEVAKS
ncbi:LapA family protein [bacterium]